MDYREMYIPDRTMTRLYHFPLIYCTFLAVLTLITTCRRSTRRFEAHPSRHTALRNVVISVTDGGMSNMGA